MSQENVQLAYRAYDAFNRRDLDAFLQLTDPGVETSSQLVAIEARSYQGHDGVREWWRDLFSAFRDMSIEALEVRDHGDFVIIRFRRRGHGVDSGAPFDDIMWQTAQWRDGLLLWWQLFHSEAEALEAAGLSE